MGYHKSTLEKIFRNIGKLGDIYYEKYLTWDKNKLERNWWEALKFFLGHSFYRGRRDELSNEYHHFAIDTLHRFLRIDSTSLDESYKILKDNVGLFDKNLILEFRRSKNIGKGNSIKHHDFEVEVASKNKLVKQLVTVREITVKWGEDTYLKKVHLGNDEDIMMVLDVLCFIANDNRKNVYRYLKEQIANSGARKAYNKLINLRAISDKIAAFIIRDIALMNPGLIKSDYEYAFPVDTWVRRIYKTLKHRKTNRVKDQDIKRFFIKKCINSHVDPLKFAAGLWFLGFHSLDIALECLEKIEI